MEKALLRVCVGFLHIKESILSYSKKSSSVCGGGVQGIRIHFSFTLLPSCLRVPVPTAGLSTSVVDAKIYAIGGALGHPGHYQRRAFCSVHPAPDLFGASCHRSRTASKQKGSSESSPSTVVPSTNPFFFAQCIENGRKKSAFCGRRNGGDNVY